MDVLSVDQALRIVGIEDVEVTRHTDGRIILRGLRAGKPVATVLRDTEDEAKYALYDNIVRNAQPRAAAR